MVQLVLDSFNSVSEMIAAFDRPLNAVFEERKSDLASITGDYDFTGTKSFDDALNQLKSGRPEIISDLKKDVEKINVVGTGVRTYRVNDFSGYAPNVGRALAGLPRDMRKKKKTKGDVKIITLVYSCSAACYIEQEQLDNSGRAFFRLAYRLEQSGIKTNIYVLPQCAGRTNENFCAMTKIKDYTGRFDITRCSFTLTSPSMLRRFGFRLLETCPNLTDKEFTYGYGRPLFDKELKSVLGKIPELKKQKYVVFSTADFIDADFDETKFIDKIKEQF